MQPVPQKYQVLAVLQIVAGICNLTFGWFFSSMVISMVAGTCTTVLTLGLCPIGFFCGFLSWLIVPIAFVEIVFGVLMLAAPDSVKGLVGWMPFAQLPSLLLGDFISPIIGIVGLVLTRDAEVAGFIEGM
ncbi:MAG: hypothetical protein ABMA64_29735 [Myxococcota bacterium]